MKKEKKSRRDAILKQKKIAQAKGILNKPVTREQLFGLQQVFIKKADSAALAVGALVDILVEKRLISYEDFSNKELYMKELNAFIQNAFIESKKEHHKNYEDQIESVYVKCIDKGHPHNILTYIFGLKKPESRIIKPGGVNVIQK